MRRALVAVIAATALGSTMVVQSAAAHDPDPMSPTVQGYQRVLRTARTTGPLAATSKSFRVVDRVELTQVPNGIGDVHVRGDQAYVSSWRPTCPDAGTWVVDISNPRSPTEVAFLPSGDHDYPDGYYTLHLDTESFSGDVLLVNNEYCDQQGLGGFDIYDISDPSNPELLADNAGDHDVFGTRANTTHGLAAWTTDSNAYAALVDIAEFANTDIDIFEITDPRNPVLLSETGAPDWPDVGIDGRSEDAFAHDLSVKRVDGRDVLVASYWDAGWVKLDVTDPANPTFIRDTDYPRRDLFDRKPPEGNAADGEANRRGRLFLGSSIDFQPFRPSFRITTGPDVGSFPSEEMTWTRPLGLFPDRTVEGTAVWGGTGCSEDLNLNGEADADEIPDADGSSVLVLTRGCDLAEPIQTAEQKGWAFVILGVDHFFSGFGEHPDRTTCPFTAASFATTVGGVCVGHRAQHLIFSDTPEYGPEAFPGSDMPPIGTQGEDVSVVARFDGWGYVDLYDFRNEGFIDSWAPGVASKPGSAFGSGVLSTFETEVDPRANLAFVTALNAGLYAVTFDRDGITPTGAFREGGGSDFWGVEVFRDDDRRFVAATDRDFGLHIFRYTGPTR